MNKAQIFDRLREQAKKISGVGRKEPDRAANNNVIEGHAIEKAPFETQYDDLQQLFRQQFPTITRQLLGKRYNTINKVSQFVLPNGMEQVADELLELLSDVALQLSSAEAVLSATGAKELAHLTGDTGRSHRAGTALTEINKGIAAVQGAFSGITGLVGAVVDLPASVVLSLKTIYEIGHAYGFDLSDEEDQKVAQFVLSKIDLGLIAEKQALFVILRGLKNIFATGDLSQVQGFLNSNYQVEEFSQYFFDASGQFKWPVLNVLGHLKVLRFAVPVTSSVVGGYYSIKLIEDVAQQANQVFASAREYLNKNEVENISILEAYQRQVGVQEETQALIDQASPLLSVPQNEEKVDEEALAEKAQEVIEQHPEISKVEIVAKPEESAEDVKQDVETEIGKGIAALAEAHVETTEETETSDKEVVSEELKQDKVKAAPKVVVTKRSKAKSNTGDAKEESVDKKEQD